MSERHEKEMSISYKDFFRLLPLVLKNTDHQIIDNKITISLPDKGAVFIEPGPEKQRKIASLTLPVVNIIFKFQNMSSDEIKKFLDNFCRVYQKGGG